jgi:hypothetical protein
MEITSAVGRHYLNAATARILADPERKKALFATLAAIVMGMEKR